MKKIFIISLLLSVSLIGFQSCKKEEKKAKKENTLKVNGESFSVNHTKNIEGDLKNKKTIITLSEISSDSKTIKQIIIGIEYTEQNNIEGEYAYPKQNGKKMIQKGDTFFQIMGSSESYTANLSSGTLKITHNEKNNYTFEIDIKTEKGDRLNGNLSDYFDVFLK